MPVIFFNLQESQDPVIRQIAEKQLVPVGKFPRDHEKAIKLICTDKNTAILNYNYRLLQLPSPCSIIRVSDVVLDVLGGIELTDEGMQYKEFMQTMQV